MRQLIRTYSVLSSLSSFDERFRYLRLGGDVGVETFGFERYLNQRFYSSSEWKKVRDLVIVRDNGCDLGIAGREIYGKILVHHMNPISAKDLEERSDLLLNPEYMICTTHETHNAIHYSNETLLRTSPVVRFRNDTSPWKRGQEL